MEYKITCLDATKTLAPYAEDLIQRSHRVLADMCEALPLTDIDLTLCTAGKDLNLPHGIGGFAAAANRVEIIFDTTRQDLQDCIERDLVPVLVHELHHAARMSEGAAGDDRLANTLAMEGLACHFEYSMTGIAPSLFNELWDQDWRGMYRRMQPELYSTSYDRDYYLLGSQPQDFPRYAAYWVGYNIVKAYLETHDVSERELVGIEAKALIDFANTLVA